MLKFDVFKRTDPRDLTLPAKFYAKPLYNVRISLRELKREIARFTTVSGPDIGAVIEALLIVIPDLLKRGHIIDLGDLGSIYITFKSNGETTAEEVTSQSITRARVRFRMSKWLKQAMRFIEFTKVEHENGSEKTNGKKS
jgi:predicted histone-like DNA-binding protein